MPLPNSPSNHVSLRLLAHCQNLISGLGATGSVSTGLGATGYASAGSGATGYASAGSLYAVPRSTGTSRWGARIFSCNKALVALCTIAFSLPAGWLTAAPDASDATLAKRRKDISELNGTQRQELVRKYDAYRQLSESDRDHLRQLHADIQADRGLQDVMKQYCDWLKNLDVTQRDQLRQAKTPEQKRDLVVKFRAEQLHQKSELFRDDLPPPERRMFSPMSSEELKTVMTVLEEELVKKEIISQPRQAEIAKLPGTQRYKALMNAIGEYRHPKENGPRRFTMPDAVLTTLADTVQNPELKRVIRTKIGMAEPGPYALAPLYHLLRGNTLLEAKREFSGADASALKESIFQTLKPEWKLRYSQMPLPRQEIVLMSVHEEELRRAFNAAAGDLPQGPPGDRGHPGRPGYQGDRPRDGGPPGGFRPGRSPQEVFGGQPPDGRRPQRDGPKK